MEERLENWIESDISIIDPDLLVIGRQIETDFGGVIDLLCIDENGDLVIIELKRDKTPREITAQVLDYASWVMLLTPDKIQLIAEDYLKSSSFEDVYQEKFNQELPESINEEHVMLIVGSEIDGSSRRIISYLSEVYGVPINAVTFNYYKHGGQEYLARTFLIEHPRSQPTSRPGTKRRQNLTFEQFQEIADEKGVGEIYLHLFTELSKVFGRPGRTRSNVSFKGTFREIKQAAIFNLIPVDSSQEKGVSWQVYDLRFREHFELDEQTAQSIHPTEKQPWIYGTPGDQKSYNEQEIIEKWSGYSGHMTLLEAKKFTDQLKSKVQ